MAICGPTNEGVIISLIISPALAFLVGFFLYKLKLRKTKHKKLWLLFDVLLAIGLSIAIFAFLTNTVFYQCSLGIYSEFTNFTYYEQNNTCNIFEGNILARVISGEQCEELIKCATEKNTYKKIEEGFYRGECLRFSYY